jgi:hypothetical protein
MIFIKPNKIKYISGERMPGYFGFALGSASAIYLSRYG